TQRQHTRTARAIVHVTAPAALDRCTRGAACEVAPRRIENLAAAAATAGGGCHRHRRAALRRAALRAGPPCVPYTQNHLVCCFLAQHIHSAKHCGVCKSRRGLYLACAAVLQNSYAGWRLCGELEILHETQLPYISLPERIVPGTHIGR